MINLTIKAKAALYKYGAIAAVVLGTLFAAYSWHKSEVRIAVKDAEFKVEQSYMVAIDEQRKRLVARSEASEKALVKAMSNTKKEKDAEVKKLNSDIASLRSELSKRPDRSVGTDLPKGTGEGSSPTGATGLQLSNVDAGFLAGYSKFTSRMQIELKACLKDYEDVKNTVNNFSLQK